MRMLLPMMALGLTAMAGSPVQAGPKPPIPVIRTIGCSPGIFWSDVINTTNKVVPAGAVVTVHGKEVPWTVTLKVQSDLLPAQSIKFADAPPAIVHCTAQAKWYPDDL